MSFKHLKAVFLSQCREYQAIKIPVPHAILQAKRVALQPIEALTRLRHTLKISIGVLPIASVTRWYILSVCTNDILVLAILFLEWTNQEGWLPSHVGSIASVELASMIEYLVIEVLKLARNVDHDKKKNYVIPCHIQFAFCNNMGIREVVGRRNDCLWWHAIQHPPWPTIATDLCNCAALLLVCQEGSHWFTQSKQAKNTFQVYKLGSTWVLFFKLQITLHCPIKAICEAKASNTSLSDTCCQTPVAFS